MRRWSARSSAVAILLAASCSLNSLDDLQGGSVDASAQCVEKVDCSGCQGCAKLCTCTAAVDFDQCYQSCQNRADAAGGAAGSAGVSGAGGGGNGGNGGSLSDGSSGNGGSAGAVTDAGICDTQNPDPCSKCLSIKCCAELTECENTPDCIALLQCISEFCQNDPTQACLDANCSQYSGGMDEYTAIGTCAQANCPECFGA